METDLEVLSSPPNISGFSNTEISIYQQVAEDNQSLQEKCDKLQQQLAFWTSLSNWCQAILAMGILIGMGAYLGYLFANIDAYQRGYKEASLKYATQICSDKYPRSTSAYRDCLESR